MSRQSRELLRRLRQGESLGADLLRTAEVHQARTWSRGHTCSRWATTEVDGRPLCTQHAKQQYAPLRIITR